MVSPHDGPHRPSTRVQVQGRRAAAAAGGGGHDLADGLQRRQRRVAYRHPVEGHEPAEVAVGRGGRPCRTRHAYGGCERRLTGTPERDEASAGESGGPHAAQRVGSARHRRASMRREFLAAASRPGPAARPTAPAGRRGQQRHQLVVGQRDRLADGVEHHRLRVLWCVRLPFETRLARTARPGEVDPRLRDLVLQRHRRRTAARSRPDLRHVQGVEAEREFSAVEGRNASVDWVLPGEQIVVRRRLALFELPGQQVLHAGARAAGVVQRILHLLPREHLFELCGDLGLLVAERGGQLVVDFLLRPLVLAAVASSQRALHLAEDRADHERNAVGPVAEFARHVAIVRDHLPVERPAELLGRRPERGGSGDNQCRIGHGLQLVDLVAREVQVLERVRRDRLLRLDARGGISRAVGVVAAALGRHLVEESLRGRRVQHADDFAATA